MIVKLSWRQEDRIRNSLLFASLGALESLRIVRRRGAARDAGPILRSQFVEYEELYRRKLLEVR